MNKSPAMGKAPVSFLLILAAVLSGGCAQQQQVERRQQSNVVPVSEDVRLTEPEAKKKMLDALDRRGRFTTPWGITDFSVTDDGVDLRLVDASDGTPHHEVLPFSQDVKLIGEFNLSDLRDRYDLLPNRCPFCWYDREDAVAFTEAFYAARRIRQQKSAPVDERELEAFQAGIAAQYRAAQPKPALPEDARRYALQAADAAKGGRYEDAVTAYQKAFEIAPWWPEGHYNCALVRGGLEQYGAAITEMRKYLLLVPDAPNARAAQDKIYVWEGRQGVK